MQCNRRESDRKIYFISFFPLILCRKFGFKIQNLYFISFFIIIINMYALYYNSIMKNCIFRSKKMCEGQKLQVRVRAESRTYSKNPLNKGITEATVKQIHFYHIQKRLRFKRYMTVYPGRRFNRL